MLALEHKQKENLFMKSGLLVGYFYLHAFT